MKFERSNEVSAWQEIRADWVNGNRTDAKEKLYQCSKVKMFRIISEALQRARIELGQGYQSGDLTDLHELMQSLAGR